MLGVQGLEAGFDGFQVSASGYHWLVHEDLLARLLVRRGF